MFGLPELGISERLNKMITGNDARTPHNDLFYSNYKYNAQGTPTWPLDYTNATPKKTGSTIPQGFPGSSSPSSSGGGSSSNVNYGSQNYKSQGDLQAEALKKQQEKEMSMINDEYKAESKRLDKMQGNTTDRYNTAQDQMKSDLSTMLDQYNQEKGTQMTGLQNTELDRAQQSRSAMDQVRNLLNDLQRKQQSYLSATGNYGSSVAEATGEQFGRQAFSSLSDVQSQRDSAMRDIANKRQQVEDFYSKKITDANSSYQSQSADLKQQFLAQLDAIDQARNASSQAKKQASMNAWQSYTNAKLNLDSQMQSYANSVNMWRAQQNQSLQEASNYDPGAVSNIDPTNAYASIGDQFGGANPQAQQARQSGWATTKKTLQDELMNQFPGLDANFLNSYNDQNVGDNTPTGVPDESGNLVDPNTGQILAPAGQW